MKLFKTNQKIYILCLALLCLSGCWSSSDQKNKEVNASSATSLSDNVLMTVNGDVVLTVEEYEKVVDMICQYNPEFAMKMEIMPNAEKDFVFKGIASSKLMKSWAEQNGVNKTPEFIEEQRQAYENVDIQLYMKYYDEAHPIHISDKELKEYYESKKDYIPALIVSPGGVQCEFVRFDSKDKAQDFFEAVKDGSAETFEKEAKSRFEKVKDALINSSSQYSQSVKKFAEKIRKTPHVGVVKVSDNSYWVILAISKDKAEYRPLESPGIKDGLRNMMMSEKKEAALDKNMESLKKEMNVFENHDYFVKKSERKRKEREETMKAQNAQQRMDYGKMKQGLEQEEMYNDNISKM